MRNIELSYIKIYILKSVPWASEKKILWLNLSQAKCSLTTHGLKKVIQSHENHINHQITHTHTRPTTVRLVIAGHFDFRTEVCVDTSAENRDPNLNLLIGLFNERSSILDRSLSNSKHVTMNLGRDYKSGTQPQLTCPTYLRH